MLLFLVTPCLALAVQPCMEWIPIYIYIEREGGTEGGREGGRDRDRAREIYVYVYISETIMKFDL